MEKFAFRPEEEAKIHLNIKTDFTFQGNEELSTHIFFNLIKNSLYYIEVAGKGQIYITIQQGKVIFKDTGTGIETHILKNLFTPFYSRRTHGTGLGLAFCKRAVESMNGKITVESEYGEHTTFVLEFSPAQ